MPIQLHDLRAIVQFRALAEVWETGYLMAASIYTLEIKVGNRLASAVCMEIVVRKKPRLGIENEIVLDLHKRQKDPWEGQGGMALSTESGSL
jgi:hypothetical protein